MKHIGILGSGPAALVTAMLLHRDGHRVELFGVPRRDDAVEGVSWRALDGIVRAGFSGIDSAVCEQWKRVSAWGGAVVSSNGEYVVHRRAFDKALLKCVKEKGITCHEAPIHHQKFDGKHWQLGYGSADGSLVNEASFCDFLVDARGGAAQKSGANEVEGPISVALVCRFTNGAVVADNRTYSEPFRKGWAWATHQKNGIGSVQIVVAPETIKYLGRDLSTLHSELFDYLPFIRNELGKKIEFDPVVEVRGIHPVLRSRRVSTVYVRIGDACYSCDPLSGHGIFEAVSGAYAALPVVNTLLRQPQSSHLAIKYYDERSRSVFCSRMEKAQEFYASETRWPEEEFWSQRRQMAEEASILLNGAGTSPSSGFYQMPVVENGYVVERRVAVVPGHPRGVRFVDGAELSLLRDAIVNCGASSDVNDLATLFGVQASVVAKAWWWLFNQTLVLRRPC